MNVANKGLCAELYELSGWEDTQLEHFTADSGEHFIRARLPGDFKSPTPAYSLGYLLRKLPMRIDGYFLVIEASDDEESVWLAHYITSDITAERPGDLCRTMSESGTPEDALCKLAIELFKQGVLKKESV